MKKILFSVAFLIATAITFGQDLPENPEQGKYYVRFKTTDVWQMKPLM